MRKGAEQIRQWMWQGLLRRLSGQRCLLPSLMAWDPSLGPTWWKERTYSQSCPLTSKGPAHVHSPTCPSLHSLFFLWTLITCLGCDNSSSTSHPPLEFITSSSIIIVTFSSHEAPNHQYLARLCSNSLFVRFCSSRAAVHVECTQLGRSVGRKSYAEN